MLLWRLCHDLRWEIHPGTLAPRDCLNRLLLRSLITDFGTVSGVHFGSNFGSGGDVADYDPKVLQKFADDLYLRASWAVTQWTAIGALLGFPAMFALQVLYRVANPGTPFGINSRTAIIVLVILCGAIGRAIGKAKAFNYKLEAQRTLCQMQLEKNTKPAS
jgi:hypothetical protein